VRLFQKQGAKLKVVMTENAKEFVSPLVLASLSKNKVYCEQFNYTDYDIEHVELSKWADIFVIAPATADTISKITNAICDNLLTSVVCAYNKKIILAPAMNVNMWENAIFQNNLNKLKSLNFDVIEPTEGYLACGDNAKGRMADLDVIVDYVIDYFEHNKNGKKILITAGGTKENIDPVRYIGNYSSGKMGIALADEAYALGYDVTLISTVTADKPYNVINVLTADEMLKAVQTEFVDSDILVMAAAVADFKPVMVSKEKIKKADDEKIVLELTKNPDILKEISKMKRDKQIVVGFCAESENLLTNAKKKLMEKKLDFIVANDISRIDIGFNSDFNEVTIIDKNEITFKIQKQSKIDIAKKILDFLK